MAVPADYLKKHKTITPSGKEQGEGRARAKRISVAALESYFGFDTIKPIVLSGSDEADVTEKGDSFQEWYEAELRRLYEGKQ